MICWEIVSSFVGRFVGRFLSLFQSLLQCCTVVFSLNQFLPSAACEFVCLGTWKITSLFVEMDHQGQSISHKLLQDGVMEDALVLDVSTVTVNIHINDERLLDFYHHMEFSSEANVIMRRLTKSGMPINKTGRGEEVVEGGKGRELVMGEKGIQWS